MNTKTLTTIDATISLANENIYAIPGICNIISSYLFNGNIDEVKAAKNGWIHWFQTQSKAKESITDAMDYAAGNGHLDLVKWLHKNRTDVCATNAMNYAALNGHLEVVKWLHKNRTEGCTTFAMNYASFNGYLDVVKWLHENRSEGRITSAIDYAVRNGHPDVIKWLSAHL